MLDNITESAVVNAELLATCGALGYFEDGTYLKEPDCLESLKDLIRYLRRDDEAHNIRRQLGELNILQTDLIPLLKYHSSDNTLFDVTLRLLVNLTNPVILLYHEELPEEKVTRNYYLQTATHLQKYKQAFTDCSLWDVISAKLKSILELEWTDRREEDKLIVERILILLRNMLHIPADPDEEKRTDDDVSIHDQVIWALHMSNMMYLVIYLAASEDEEEFSFHVLEIISHILREQVPQQLADAGRSRSKSEKERDIQELNALRLRENDIKRTQQKTPTRHPRFGGTFCIKNLKSISERDVICHQPLAHITAATFDSTKKLRRVAKNRFPMQDTDFHRRSTLSIRNCLKEFCTDLLSNAYNPLMVTVKNQLTQRRAQDHDETYYLWAMRFFMEFNRLHEFDVARVSETVSIQIFHYVHTQLENYSDMMATEKKKFSVWSKRMHIGLKAYHELLLSLVAMETSPDVKVQNSAKVIKGNILYVVEYRDLLLHFLMNYDEVKFPKSYLRDLVLTNHTFMKMMESFSKGHRTLLVQHKKQRKRKKQDANKKKARSVPSELSEEQLEQLWDEIADPFSATIQSCNLPPSDSIPIFDAASDRTSDEQRADAVGKIQESLRLQKLEEAISLFRTAREVWPEENVFGSSNMAPNQEFTSLREIFFANLPRRPVSVVEEPAEEKEGDDSQTENEAETSQPKTSEQVFNFFDFLKRFASPRVVQPYVLLLSQYEKNESQTNRSVVRMMHRIAWDCKMYGLFFQASLFRIFQRILNDPARRTDSTIKELSRFAVFIIRKFFENASTNRKIFMEMLFWKSSREVCEIQEGYGSYEKMKGAKVLWTEDQDHELRTLHEQYKDVQEEGKDVVDLILDHMIDDSKNRRQVIKQLKVLALLDKDSKLTAARHKPISVRPSVEWKEEEIADLRDLFQQFKESTDIMGRIVENLTVRRPKRRVVEKLLELGIVGDRKELRKKRASQTRKKDRQSSADQQDDGEDAEEDSDEVLPSADDDDSDDSEADDDDQGDVVEAPQKPLNQSAVKEAFDDVLASEYRPALQWLKLSLESVLEDRQDEEDDAQSTPLVPLLDVHQNAMQSNVFQNLLKIFGISPPSSHQEAFWRVPAELSADALKLGISVIEKCEKDGVSSLLSEDFPATNSREGKKQTTTNARRRLSSAAFPKESHRKRKRKFSEVDDEFIERREEERDKADDDVGNGVAEESKHLSDSGDEAVSERKSSAKKRKRRTRFLDESDSESEKNGDRAEERNDVTVGDLCHERNDADDREETSDGENLNSNPKKRIRKRIAIESDDDDD